MRYLLPLLLLTGCATKISTVQQSSSPAVVQSVVMPPMPVAKVLTLQWTNSATETCAWWAVQGSDDGVTWTNEFCIRTAEPMTERMFTNSTPTHFWRYVVHN